MEFDVSALVEETAAQFREPAEAVGLRLSCEIEPSLHTKGVPEQLAELAGILLDNAVKYSAPGGEINLALRRESGRVTLRIRNACAEPPEEPERLFDRFYRGDSARTQSTGGTGLGLSIARALAENMGASLAAARIGETEIEFTARLH